jgi:hypothetical protein
MHEGAIRGIALDQNRGVLNVRRSFGVELSQGTSAGPFEKDVAVPPRP